MYVGYATHLAKFGITVRQHPQNTQRRNRPKKKIINGIPTTFYGQNISPSICASTNRGDDPCVQLDLKKAYLVSRMRVTIYASTGSNVVVRVGNNLTNNGNDNHVCGTVPYVASENRKAVWRNVSCSPPEWGRYINLDRTAKDNYLEICEAAFEYGQWILCCNQQLHAVMVLLLQKPV